MRGSGSSLRFRSLKGGPKTIPPYREEVNKMELTKDQKEASKDSFPILCLFREDIKQWFNLTEQQVLNIDDDDMWNIARQLSEAYSEHFYWIVTVSETVEPIQWV